MPLRFRSLLRTDAASGGDAPEPADGLTSAPPTDGDAPTGGDASGGDAPTGGDASGGDAPTDGGAPDGGDATGDDAPTDGAASEVTLQVRGELAIAGQIPSAQLPSSRLPLNGVLDPLPVVPAAADYGVGDVINVRGTLYVLAAPVNNELHGVAARNDDYYGVSVLGTGAAVGSWSDPAARAEWEWAGTTTAERQLAAGIPLARLRLPRALFAAAPPPVLYGRLDVEGVYSSYVLTRDAPRDTGLGTGSGATGFYAWKAGVTGAGNSGQPGAAFRVDLFTDDDFSVGLTLHTANVWQPYRPPGAGQTADQVQELARDAAAKALANGSGDVAFTGQDADDEIDAVIKDAAVTPPKLDAGDDAKRRALRDRIGAEGLLQAGTGITIGAADAAGRRRIATDNPHSRAGGDLAADDTYEQTLLDPVNEWRLEAVQKIDPHVVRLDYDSAEQKFSGKFPITHDGSVTGELEYRRVGCNHSGAGKFSLTATPALTTQTLARKFGAGKIDALILQIGATKAEAESAQEREIPIQDNDDSSSMVAKSALTSDPEQMATATVVYARVNLQFEYVVWERDTAHDIPGEEIRKVFSGITAGSMAVIDNGVILIGNTVSMPSATTPATRHVDDGENDVKNSGVPEIYGITAVDNYLAYGGGPTQSGVRFWDITHKKVVPDLAIGASKLTAVNSTFEIGAIAFDSTDRRLYVIDHNSDNVVAFAAVKRAYPDSEHSFRTMDRERLKAEAREEHVRDLSLNETTLTVSKVAEDGTPDPKDLKLPVGVEAVDKLPPPGTAGRRVWVKTPYEVRSVYVQPFSFDGTALQNSDLGARGYWRRAANGWAVGSLLGDFPALHLLSDSKLALLAGQVAGPTKLHVGDDQYVLAADSKNTRLLGGYDTRVDLYTITGGMPPGDWNDVWIEGATSSDRTPAAYDVKRGEYLDTGSAWSPAGFDAPLGNAAHDFDLLIRERIPGAAQTVTEVLRTLDRRTLRDAIQGWTQGWTQEWFAPWAQADSSAGIPLARLPIEKLTQAEYDAKVAANTVDANTLYVIVG